MNWDVVRDVVAAEDGMPVEIAEPGKAPASAEEPVIFQWSNLFSRQYFASRSCSAMTIVPMLRVGTQFVTLRVTSVLPHNIHVLRAGAANAVLFNRDGTDDAECDVSDG
ncbi:hypothetical protein RYB01_18155 [Pseudomonas syringae]|nr:hypothetical protein [Pseudomonas syringae]